MFCQSLALCICPEMRVHTTGIFCKNQMPIPHCIFMFSHFSDHELNLLDPESEAVKI